MFVENIKQRSNNTRTYDGSSNLCTKLDMAIAKPQLLVIAFTYIGFLIRTEYIYYLEKRNDTYSKTIWGLGRDTPKKIDFGQSVLSTTRLHKSIKLLTNSNVALKYLI